MTEGDNVSEPWYTDDVTELTDVDLQAARYASINLSAPDEYSYRLVETARQNDVLETPSATIDRGLRIELAYLIDTDAVSFSRTDYNIKYTIPPFGWIFEQEFEKIELIPYGKSGIEWAKTDERSITATTTRVCKDMIDKAVEKEVAESISDICRRGLERMIGHRGVRKTNSSDTNTNQRVSEVIDEYPIITLFKGQAYNRLTEFSIKQTENLPTEWYRKIDLTEEAGCSTTAFDNAREDLIGYGILEKSDRTEDVKMPRYRIADSIVVQFLKDFHANYSSYEDPHASVSLSEVSLIELMESSGRARLIAWFLADSNRENNYSKNEIIENSPVSSATVREYIDELAQLGIVNTKEKSRGSQTYTEYAVNNDSPINLFLNHLNETAYVYRTAKEFEFDNLLEKSY